MPGEANKQDIDLINLLFVCGGNTCRSPMAVGIARTLSPAPAQVESAGIAPHGHSAEPDAVAVVRDKFGVDISRHRPHSIKGVDLRPYTRVVAMEPYVARALANEHGVPLDKLAVWDIKDPFRCGRPAYERCADEIHRLLTTLIADLDAFHLGDVKADPATSRNEDPTSLADRICRLRDDLYRWDGELASGVLRGTLLQGIAKKAADSFETALREAVRSCVSIARGDQPIPSVEDTIGRGKDLDRLTMGEMVEYVGRINRILTVGLRVASKNGQVLFQRRRALSRPLEEQLNRVVSLRNRLHHHPDDFASSEEVLALNTKTLLLAVRGALEDAFFRFCFLETSGEQR